MNNIEISLTTFGDFLAATGRRKISTVREAQRLYAAPYNPAIDYWRLLRDGIVDLHSGRADLEQLRTRVANCSANKRRQYADRLKSFEAWVKKTDWTWVDPESGLWHHGGVSVRCNPELGLQVGGVEYLVKLYFREEKLRSLQVEATLELMAEALPTVREGKRAAAVLDLARGRLLCTRHPGLGTTALLRGEAVAFYEMWIRIAQAA